MLSSWRDLTESRKRLLYLFGLILAFQWIVFMVMVVAEMSHGASITASGTPARGLKSLQVDRVVFNRTAASTCFSAPCLEEIAMRLSRVYPNQADHSFCIASGRNKDAQDKWQGLILVKVPKVASSTAAGVTIRISRNSQQQQQQQHTAQKPCKAVQWRHKPARTYANRSRAKSFVWTTVRDPAARAVSTVFYHNISRRRPSQQHNVPDEDIIQQLQGGTSRSTHEHFGAVSEGQGGFQLRYTAFREIEAYDFWNASRPRRVRHPTALHNLVRETLARYDFVAVTDRMEESLVVLALLLNVPVSDVLVTSSKVVAGGQYQFVHLPGNTFKCLPTVFSYVNPKVQRFLESDRWKAPNWGDYLLHKAASISLDRTIQALGPDRFEKALLEYRRLREMEELHCSPNVKFPCSDNGVPQPDLSKESCYLPFFDFGCGYKCIDDLVEQEKMERAAYLS